MVQGDLSLVMLMSGDSKGLVIRSPSFLSLSPPYLFGGAPNCPRVMIEEEFASNLPTFVKVTVSHS